MEAGEADSLGGRDVTMDWTPCPGLLAPRRPADGLPPPDRQARDRGARERAGAGRLDRTVPAGMVLANTKLEALQPSFSASWLQLWMSMRYRVKGCRLEMTVLSLLSTLLS